MRSLIPPDKAAEKRQLAVAQLTVDASDLGKACLAGDY
jgi:hypothetical protein